MAVYASYLITMVFLLSCLQFGTSLKCYECKSEFNGNCDNIKGKSINEELCESSKLAKYFPQAGSKYVCVKHRMAQKDDTQQKVPIFWDNFIENEPNLNVVRGCAPDNYCSSFKNSKECLTCDTNLCNSSSAIMPSIVLSIFSIILCAKYNL